LQSEFEDFYKSGDPLKILQSNGVKVFASPVTNASSANASALDSHQQVPVVSSSTSGVDSANKVVTTSSISYVNTGWKLQFTVNPTSADSTHLMATFDIDGLLTSKQNKDAPNAAPQTSVGHFPYDGIVPLDRYYLLGNIDMTSDSSTDPTLNAPIMLALLVKVERL
jgi:hypothetical protein